MTETGWTYDRKAMLKFWWLHEQFTSTRIVELFAKDGFHTTRNAIIGAVHRSDWWAGQSRPRTPPRPKAPRAARPPPVARPKPPRVPNVPKPTPRPRPHAPGQPLYLAVTEVGFGECRYWFGEARDKASPKTRTGFCGQQVEAGSWCPGHRALVYSKSNATRTPWIEPRVKS